MKNRIIFSIYIIFIIMMANDAFFSWLGMQIHISFWRQLITIVGLIVVYHVIRKKKIALYEIRKILGKYKYMFLTIFGLSLLTIIIHGFNIIRIVYSWWSYAFGLPFIIFPYYARQCGWSRRKIDYLFVYLGLFLSVGIYADFMFGGLFTKSFLLAVTQGEGSFEGGRYCFLSTAPTIFSIYYCLCMMCCMHAYKYENIVFRKMILLFCALFFIFGSIFCGSRQTLVALVLVFFLCFLSSLLDQKKSSIFIFFLVSIAVVISYPFISSLVNENSAVEQRYTIISIQEDERNKTWGVGLRECITEPTLKRILIGDGIGYTFGQQAVKDEVVGNHYENTFFTRICEMGWFLGFYMLLLPFFYIVKRRKMLGTDSLMYLSLCMAYIFICCISPNGGSNTAQMSLFITLGLFIEDARERKYKTKMA